MKSRIEESSAKRLDWRFIAIPVILIIAVVAVALTVVKDSAIPEAPDLTGEQKRAEQIVKEYESAARARDPKKAWGLLSEGLQKVSKKDLFEKGIKDFPKEFSRFEIDTKSTDRLTNMSYQKEYARILNKQFMEGAWVVTSKHTGVSKDSPDYLKTFVVIQEKGKFRIYDIR